MMEVFDVEQGSAEWFAARLGIPTASNFATVLASGRGGGPSVTRRTYLLKLAGEILTGEPADHYSNGDMARGNAMEAEARGYYALTHDAEPQLVGFIKSGQKGCSPDALLGNDGMLEVKTAYPHILIDHLLRDRPPPEHHAQLQGNLWIAEREWIDIIVYWPRVPALVKRVYRDDLYIEGLSAEVDQFNDDLAKLVEQIREMGG